MKVLLLHPKDTFLQFQTVGPWDLVIDLARAPVATYEHWARQAGCSVITIHQFAQEVDDLCYLKKLLQAGFGYMVDGYGIDWWDVLSMEIVADLRQLVLVRRLAKDLSGDCELYLSRSSPLGTALHSLIDGKLINRERTAQRAIGGLRCRWHALSHLDASQLAQALQDKFDSQHTIRRRVTIRRHLKQPVILLPTAYVNSSRTAVAYAQLLPGQQFMLMYTRRSGKLPSVPGNVCQVPLSPYFVKPDDRELGFLLDSWTCTKERLIDAAPEFRMADASGLFERIPALLRSGVSFRDAWNQVFESSDITGCLCTDDSNPPTRIALLLAKNRRLPNLAVHHGALDYAMTFKTHHADAHLAKTKMEEEYLVRTCRLPRDKLLVGGPAQPHSVRQPAVDRSASPWMVFFTEPYQNYSWRSDEVYCDLLPRVLSLAQACGLKLVFKLHPFESARGHRKLLRQMLKGEERNVETISGPLNDDLWPKIRFALTVQSSTALECAARRIPVFLCAWLRDSYSGYVEQFERFAVGSILESPEQIGKIPHLLKRQAWNSPPGAESRPIDSELLESLLSGRYSMSTVCTA